MADLIAKVESGDGYSWSATGIFKDDDGYYVATDGGCSCNAPFRDRYTDSLTGPMTREQAISEFHNLTAPDNNSYFYQYDQGEVADVIAGLP